MRCGDATGVDWAVEGKEEPFVDAEDGDDSDSLLLLLLLLKLMDLAWEMSTDWRGVEEVMIAAGNPCLCSWGNVHVISKLMVRRLDPSRARSSARLGRGVGLQPFRPMDAIIELRLSERGGIAGEFCPPGKCIRVRRPSVDEHLRTWAPRRGCSAKRCWWRDDANEG